MSKISVLLWKNRSASVLLTKISRKYYDRCAIIALLKKTMIKSFADKETEELFHGRASNRSPVNIQRVALRKLWMIDAAIHINDLRVPPGNHLEKLSGRLLGSYSIRINNQWRVLFQWHETHAEKVQIVDYH